MKRNLLAMVILTIFVQTSFLQAKTQTKEDVAKEVCKSFKTQDIALFKKHLSKTMREKKVAYFKKMIKSEKNKKRFAVVDCNTITSTRDDSDRIFYIFNDRYDFPILKNKEHGHFVYKF